MTNLSYCHSEEQSDEESGSLPTDAMNPDPSSLGMTKRSFVGKAKRPPAGGLSSSSKLRRHRLPLLWCCCGRGGGSFIQNPVVDRE